MSEQSTTAVRGDSEQPPVRRRLRRLLRRFDPTMLGLLGLLSLPAHLFESLAFLDIFSLFFVFFLWMFVGPLVDAALAGDQTKPTDWVEMGSPWGLLGVVLSMLNPLVLAQDLTQGVGGLLAVFRHRGSLPDAASYDQAVPYRLPVEGTWTVVNGSPEQEYSHSWIYPSQRYAYDLVVTDESGRTRPEGANSGVEAYYCYDEPVVAPADGVVVDALDAVLESSRASGLSHPLKRSILGGHVVIRHADSEYSTLAHLRPGSVTVEPGDRVTRGQEVGRCGHSGNSSEPHLHFQIQDRPDPLTGASLPVQFETVRIESPGATHDPGLVPGREVWHSGTDDGAEQTRDEPNPGGSPVGYHDRTFVIAGQRVTHVDRSDDTGSQDRSPTRLTDERVPGGAVRSPGTRAARVLRRVALGVVTAGILTFVANTLLSGLAVAAVLAGGAVAGVAFRYGFGSLHDDRFQGRSGSVGSSLGLGLAAAVATGVVTSGVGTGPLVGLFLAAGTLGYVLLGEYDARRLRLTARSG